MPNKPDKWRGLTLAKLEADIAYFDARLSLFKDGPVSCYREAEIKAYRELEALLSFRLSRLSGPGPALPDSYPGLIEVEEILDDEAEEDDEQAPYC